MSLLISSENYIIWMDIGYYLHIYAVPPCKYQNSRMKADEADNFWFLLFYVHNTIKYYIFRTTNRKNNKKNKNKKKIKNKIRSRSENSTYIDKSKLITIHSLEKGNYI